MRLAAGDHRNPSDATVDKGWGESRFCTGGAISTGDARQIFLDEMEKTLNAQMLMQHGFVIAQSFG